jgi:hypothetical protein
MKATAVFPGRESGEVEGTSDAEPALIGISKKITGLENC